MGLRLLGPVEIWVDGRALSIGRPQQLTVLAALAVDVGRMVSTETLVERVWGQTPPDRARRTLHTHITRIRRDLKSIDPESAEPARVARRSGGYVLEMDPDGIDLHRFRRLVKQAADGQCRQDARLLLLRQAIALWHGEPLSGVPGDWAEHRRESLLLERLDAVDHWAQTELKSGNAQRVIAELAGLTREYPLMERLAETLIRALYLAGRPAEALDRYAAVRRHLAETLGTEPGAELRRLHQTILRGEDGRPSAAGGDDVPTPSPAAAQPERAVPQLPSTPGALPPSARSVVPAQLPMNVRGFTGRDAEMSQLDDILRTSSTSNALTVSVLWGPAGAGKTSLAVHWAHRVAAQFPDGQLYVNLRGFEPGGTPVTSAEVIRGFLDAFEVPPQRIPVNLAAQAALYRSLVASRRVLVVLDNVRDAEQVRPLLPGASGSMVLVTSRRRLLSLIAVEGAYPLTVDVLSAAEARKLLASRLGAMRLATHDDAVDRIIVRCARLPLALAVVAARAASHPQLTLNSLAEQLDGARGGLDAFAGTDLTTDMRAVFSWTYQTLSPAAARLFRLLGLTPGPDLNQSAAAHLVGVAPAEIRPLVNELIDAHMLTEHQPGRLSCHELLRAYAMELVRKLEPVDEQSAAIHRVLDYYVATTHIAAALLDPHRSTSAMDGPGAWIDSDPIAEFPQALAWLTAEHAVLLAVVRQAAESGFEEALCAIARSLMEYLNRQGHWRDLVATQRLALTAAQRIGDREAEAQAHRGLGLANAWLGRYDEAYTHSSRALDLSNDIGSIGEQAQAHLALARVFERQDRHREALHHDEAALTLAELADDRLTQAVSLNNVGWSNAMLGNYERALARCSHALRLLQEIGDPHGQAATWDSLGYIHHSLDQLGQATECYRQAVELYRDAGSRYGEADSLNHLGDTLLALADTNGAKQTWQQAIPILHDLDHVNARIVQQKLNRLHLSPSTCQSPQ